MRFLDAEMDADEMDSFEKELQHNPEMRQQLNFEQSLRNSFSASPPASTYNEGRKIRKPVHIVRLLQAAAAIAVILLAVFIFQRSNKAVPPDTAQRTGVDTSNKKVQPPTDTTISEDIAQAKLEALFRRYYKKDSIPSDYPLYLAQAFTDYESGEYSTFQRLDLNNIPETRGTGNESAESARLRALGFYFKGLSFLQTNNSIEAIKNLTEVLNNKPDKALTAKARWYLMLAYLKANDRSRAMEECRRIITANENRVLVNNAKRVENSLKFK